ncbi:MAG TPA: serine/threonine-protein kinase, partial [Conexibacter sp.]|nr:serine/threonine-protein kinase [Conexibacter sp.]
MTEAKRTFRPLILRRPSGQSSAGATFTPELTSAAADRLGALAQVVAGVVALMGAIAYLTGAPSAIGQGWRLAACVADIVVSFGLYAGVATRRLEPARALRAGVVYQPFHALLASLVFYSMTQVQGVAVRGWTPVAVWIVLYPLIVPSRPSRVWVASLVTAAMDPLSLWINVKAAGTRWPSPAETAQLFFPTVLACILAPIAAPIVYSLTAEVKRAREMGAYRLVEKLGQGGMGEVWRAEHRMLARSAAIKLIRPSALGVGEGSQSVEVVKRFEREAQATARLRSPHTIAVYDYGVADDGTFHYVMELLEGFSLHTLVERFGPVEPARVVHMLRQACHSLAEAHAAGLVHRDIKPANMFACRLGLEVDFVKVLDFGLVKLQGPQARGAQALTVEGAFTGTPAFMPPEIALGAERVDGRADIYALGCVAYWLLTGTQLFAGGTPMQVVLDHIRTDPEPPSRRTDQPIPEALEQLVMRCLA